MNDVDVSSFLRSAIAHTASRLGITGSELMNGDELQERIDGQDAETGKLLREFIAAYREWYSLSKQYEDRGKLNSLDPDELEGLNLLVEKRNKCRASLISRLDSTARKVPPQVS